MPRQFFYERGKYPPPGWCCKCEINENIIWDCHCYEDIKQYDWKWLKDSDGDGSVKISNEEIDVFFHPYYSAGTAVVRGDTPLRKNMHYYWEIKILSNLYGTDVMIGIGTTDMVITDEKLKFCSLLGLNSQSWGYSYSGLIQHQKMRRSYGYRFDKGSIIGVYLDMCQGTLQYYLNRRPLGLAFKDLKKHELYPMMCSTAAKSAMRLCCAVAEEPSLQLLCLQVIKNHPDLKEKCNSIPGLKRIYERRYFWVLSNEIPVNNNKVPRGNVAYLREKRPLLLDEARADPDHISYRELIGKKLKKKKSMRKTAARHHSLALNTEFAFVYCSDDSDSEDDDDDMEEYCYYTYCANCNIKVHANAIPYCLSCSLAMTH